MDRDSSSGYKRVGIVRSDEATHGYKMKEKRWYHDVADFANLLKSFIGTNYLALAFGLRQSGLALGVFGLCLVAAMTTHCCRLIVKVKYHAVRKLVTRRPSLHESIPEFEREEDKAHFEHLQRTMSFADIGGIAYGRWGIFLVNTFLVITQVGFCINYHIFIGSSMYSLLLGNENKANITNHTNDFLYDAGVYKELSEILNGTSPSDVPTFPPTTSSPPAYNAGPWIPSLSLLVCAPLPLFIAFTLIRRVRLMGPISFVANGTMTAGYILVVGYMIANFSLAPDIVMAKWATFPVFLGQTSASYEAIGTILSIEASMEGNHNRYPACLLSVVAVFSAMLTASSVIGYLMYGENTKQILVQNLPQTGAIVLVVNIALITAVLFTYPLQVFPVVEILEAAIFAKASPMKPRSAAVTEDDPLIADPISTDSADHMKIAAKIPASVATWKRNMLRITIALTIGVLAVLLRDVFAYVSAFVGALGSCPLAFILPFLFHLKLCRHELSRGIIVKDIIMIVIGTIMAVVSLVVVVIQVVVQLKNSTN